MRRLTFRQDTIQLNGFWAHKYPVERLAVSGTQLASGAHKEVKIWSQSPEGKSYVYLVLNISESL